MSIFGKSKDGASFVKKNYWKLKDGEQVFRILPAIGDLAKDGIWSKYYSVHFGYKNTQGKMRPFQSSEVKNNKTKMIEVPDAAKQRIETLKAELEKAKIAGNKDLVSKLLKFVGPQGQFNLDNNHYLNAMDEHGNIGVLKLRHRAKAALDTLIKKLEKEGVDPRDPSNGRFLVFSRSGNGTDTQFVVSVKQEELEVPGVGKVKRDVVSSLTSEMADRMGTYEADGSFKYKEASNLLTLFRKPTSAEVERIVKEGAKAVDDIFDTKKELTTLASQDDISDEYGLDSLEEPQVTTVFSTVPPTVVPVTASTSSTSLPKETPVSSLPQVQALTASVMTPSPKTTAELLASQSDEDFFKSLGVSF